LLPPFLGLTPQANHLSPLRGSDRASEGAHCEPRALASERRRRDIYLAWGVSPRYSESQKWLSPWRGRQTYPEWTKPNSNEVVAPSALK